MAANDSQVGGNHYQTTHQHWDFAADGCLGYFEGQITKYITRHRKKKGREDAEKCLHFVRKLRERYDSEKSHPPIHQHTSRARVNAYCLANGLTEDERVVVGLACNWINEYHLDVLEMAVQRVITETYDHPGDPGNLGDEPLNPRYYSTDEACSNYVNPDRNDGTPT